ncbi:hypothetical protein NDI56_11600 [Haloarcula sp. S1CR25-12]|uniref:Uncharacterized protein n=1 Tax=Haloarcula saliterrae TaxID=2950534 RepID=A0ABU2FCQ5_9EURY|nr:hypothetical protein [Haloarcula sp. S1CR25-12]MDS0260039.1 hypothetical protein [Haloarcula sp. S1CR25-12]
MALWAAVRVAVGTTTTVVSTVLVAVLLPLVGLGTANVVGDSLPVWLFALPLLVCPVVGGALTGFLHGAGRRVDMLLAGVAAALGTAVVGVLFALGLVVLLLGMTPAHTVETPTFSGLARSWAPLGAGLGFVVGAVLGGLGGVGGSALRRAL